jgi:siderophore synthetase component
MTPGCVHPAADELPEMQAHRAFFYGTVYGVVQDTGRLLAALLAKKERVAEAALRQVVAEALG